MTVPAAHAAAQLLTFLQDQASRRAHGAPPRELPELEAARQFQSILFDAGLAGPSWPREDGGLGLDAGQRSSYASVLEQFDLPVADLTLSLAVCGPAVMHFGSEAQRRRHGEATLRGEHVWCQLWSEPDAGSDLPAVRTRALHQADGSWVVNGRKIWTSGAHFADYGLLLARTGPQEAGHRSLSMLVVDMHAPGVTVRPIQQMTGRAHFNEVTFDDVRLPDGALLGTTDDGWSIVVWMMGQERSAVGLSARWPSALEVADVVDLARAGGRLDEPRIRSQIALLACRERAAKAFNTRLGQELESGSAALALGSAVKLLEARLLQDCAELAFEVAGAVTWSPDDDTAPELATALLAAPGLAIGGGTEDIQLNALADRLLGLPR